jgi:hypothetical protein
MAAEVNEQLLDERLAELEKARARVWSPSWRAISGRRMRKGCSASTPSLSLGRRT